MQSLMEAQTRPCLHFVHSSSLQDLVNNPKPLQLVRQQHFQFAGTCAHQPFIKSELWKAYDTNHYNASVESISLQSKLNYNASIVLESEIIYKFRWHGQHL